MLPPTKRKSLLIIVFLYVISILCRLPNLDRPLSKHHEFNPATVLIAVEAWQERGGGSKYAFVPFINYAKPGDYMKDKSWALDGNGNGIYLSYGPGMYVIPYLIFRFLHLAATPLHLQIINLGFLLFAVLLLFHLLAFIFNGLQQQYLLTIFGCFFFLFNPCILWFLGNGYVNVTIAVPFLLGSIYQFLLIRYRQKKSYKINYFLLAFFLIAGIYIDWITFFAAAVIGFFDLLRSVRQRRFPIVGFVCAGSVVLGITLIIWQFSHYLSLQQITGYWRGRFYTRSIEDTGLSFVQKCVMLFNNLLSGYLPVLVLCVAIIFIKRKAAAVIVPQAATTYLLVAGIACVLYNVTFFNWSYIHDFSLVPIGIFISFLPVYLIVKKKIGFENNIAKTAFSVYFIITMAQYFYINRPGKTSQNGDQYALYKNLGERLKTEVQPDEMIFMNSQSPILNYYAKRFTFKAHNLEEAKEKLHTWNYPKGVWIDEDSFYFKSIQRVMP